MSTTEKATARPWVVQNARTGRATYTNATYVRAEGTLGEAAICKVLRRRTSLEREANAELICKAVNAHDGLVALARLILATNDVPEGEVRAKARQCLKLAEGE